MKAIMPATRPIAAARTETSSMRNCAGGESLAAAVLFWPEPVGSGVLIDALCSSSFRGRCGLEKCRVSTFSHDAAKSSHQRRPGRADLIVMMERQFAQDFFSFRSERQQNLATVVLGARAVYKSSRFKAVHQFHGAVVAD